MLLVRSYRTFAPLPLTRQKSKDRTFISLLLPFSLAEAVCFCGTILTVTRTGRYPASLVFREPGLSSDSLVIGNPQPPAPTLSLIQSSRG